MIWWHRWYCGEVKWSPFGVTYQQARCSGCGKRWVK